MTKKELVLDIKDELTFSKALPFSLPTKEIERVIRIGSSFFYDNWRHAVEPKYLVIPLNVFSHKKFRSQRAVQLPDCVKFVHEVKEIKGSSIFATIDRDFSEQKFIGSEIFLTPFMGESIVYRTAVFSFLDLTRNLVLDTIAYDFNKNNHVLTIVGRTPKTNVVVAIARSIEEEHLYEDELFQRYVRAKAKMRLGEMLDTFDFQLPGGVRLNYGNTVTKAEKEMENVEKMLSSENVPDFMFLERF